VNYPFKSAYCSCACWSRSLWFRSDDTTFNKRTWSHNLSASWLSAAWL